MVGSAPRQHEGQSGCLRQLVGGKGPVQFL
jgi:hypothetical protein